MIYKASADAAPRVVGTSAASLSSGDDPKNPAVHLNVIDAEIDAYLYSQGLREQSAKYLAVGDYWSAIRDDLKARHPEVPNESWEDFVSSFWPEVQRFLRPLQRDTLLPFISVRCAHQEAPGTT